jgi:hypothetical protein
MQTKENSSNRMLLNLPQAQVTLSAVTMKEGSELELSQWN